MYSGERRLVRVWLAKRVRGSRCCGRAACSPTGQRSISKQSKT